MDRHRSAAGTRNVPMEASSPCGVDRVRAGFPGSRGVPLTYSASARAVPQHKLLRCRGGDEVPPCPRLHHACILTSQRPMPKRHGGCGRQYDAQRPPRRGRGMAVTVYRPPRARSLWARWLLCRLRQAVACPGQLRLPCTGHQRSITTREGVSYRRRGG